MVKGVTGSSLLGELQEFELLVLAVAQPRLDERRVALVHALEVLAADGRGGAFVYGQRRGEDTNGYVVRLDAGGKTIGLADLTGNARSDIGALIPDDEGVWVVGTGKPPSGGPWELWVERVEFD